MSEVSAELVWLLERLRSTPSRWGRLRLLLEAWQTVRGLSPTDRLLVARELGFDGAERLVAEVAQRRSFEAAPWLEMLDKAEHSDPEELSELVRGLADPDRRIGALGRLLAGTGALLARAEASQAPEADSLAWEQREAASDIDADDTDLAGGGSGDDASADEVESGLEFEAGEELAQAPAPESPAGAAEPPPTAFEGAVGLDADAAGAAAPEPVAAEPAVEMVETSTASRMPPEPGPAGGAPPPENEAGARRLAATLAAEPRIQRRLARLARERGVLELAPRETLEAVLECFPAGWARRRALQRLIEAGIPASVADAVALLEMLERPSERLWAVTALLESRALGDDDWEALLATEPSPAARRRLERRRAKTVDRG